MIIDCNNCNKKFNVDSSLIPDKGRLLQCTSCDHKWFFKKEVLEKKISPIVEDISIDSASDQDNSSINEEKSVSDVPKNDPEVELEKDIKEKIEININESAEVNTNQKSKKTLKY